MLADHERCERSDRLLHTEKGSQHGHSSRGGSRWTCLCGSRLSTQYRPEVLEAVEQSAQMYPDVPFSRCGMQISQFGVVAVTVKRLPRFPLHEYQHLTRIDVADNPARWKPVPSATTRPPCRATSAGERRRVGAVLVCVGDVEEVQRINGHGRRRYVATTMHQRFASYCRPTSCSTESLGSSPSTTAGDCHVLQGDKRPRGCQGTRWSAASRPVAMRTIDCRGARHVASTTRQTPSINASATA